jgi:uncharacterized coiled-coil protein SlyX
MDDLHEEEETEHSESRVSGGLTRGAIILIVLFAAVAIFGIGYAFHESAAATGLATQNQSLRSSLDQMHRQMDTLTAKLDQLKPAPPPEQAAPSKVTNRARPAARRAPGAVANAEARRLRQLQLELAEQRKQLRQMQDQVVGTKSALEGELGSTRDELNGSIARNHTELVALEKRGERNYYEFDLWKSKNFTREGPIQLSLRKADTKHQSYNLVMLVNDHQLSKKKVDLYEPIWLREADEPLQVVINKIEKNHVHGYASAPKYTEAELASGVAGTTSGPTPEPASTVPSNLAPTSSSTPTSTPATSSSTSRR